MDFVTSPAYDRGILGLVPQLCMTWIWMRPTGVWMVSVNKDYAFPGQHLLQLGTKLHGSSGHTRGVHFSLPPTSPFFGHFQSFGDYFRTDLKTRMSVRRKRTQTTARNSAFGQISRCFLRFFKQWSPKSRFRLKGLPGRQQKSVICFHS